jgi:hypothetical protein
MKCLISTNLPSYQDKVKIIIVTVIVVSWNLPESTPKKTYRLGFDPFYDT